MRYSLGCTFTYTTSRLTMNRKTSGVYGQDYLVCRHLGIESLPGGVAIQHGWTPRREALASDIARGRNAMLCWNARYKRSWDATCETPCFVIGSPYVHYRRAEGIVSNPDAHGTLAFPAHSTNEVRADFGIDEYCDLLKSLPQEFQPVTISLHYSDIMYHGLDKEFARRGFNVVCTTANNKRPAYEAFYDVLRNFKYTTANEPGSYTFYAVEMGIPFFILGEPAVRDNSGGANADMKAGPVTIRDYEYGKVAFAVFAGEPSATISNRQREFVESELGIDDAAPTEEVRAFLSSLEPEPAQSRAASFRKRIARLAKNPRQIISGIRDSYLYWKHFG